MNTELLESDILLETAAYELEVQRDMNVDLVTLILEAGDTSGNKLVEMFNKWWGKMKAFFNSIIDKMKAWYDKVKVFAVAQINKIKGVKKESEKVNTAIPTREDSDKVLKVVKDSNSNLAKANKSIKKFLKYVNNISISTIESGKIKADLVIEDFLKTTDDALKSAMALGKNHNGWFRDNAPMKKQLDKFFTDIQSDADMYTSRLKDAFGDMEKRIKDALAKIDPSETKFIALVKERLTKLRKQYSTLIRVPTVSFNNVSKLTKAIF